MTGYPTRRNASLAQPSVDLRGLLMPVINQELRPLCLPVSVSAAHEAGRTAPPDQLAPDALWSSCAAAGLTTTEGTTLTAVAQALTTDGQPTLTNWPYSATPGPHAEPPPTSATSADWYLAEMIDVPLAHDGIEDPIEDVLATGNCVVLVLEVTDQFQDATTDGTIAVPPLNAPTGAYHAVLVVGVATRRSRRCLLIRNTWGPGWGAGGFGWLPLDYLAAFGGEAAAVDPTTHRTSPPPNP